MTLNFRFVSVLDFRSHFMSVCVLRRTAKKKQRREAKKNHERNFQNEKQCFSTSKRIHTCITYSLCEDQLKCKVCLRQRLYYGWESAYIFPHWRDWWFHFFFLNSLVHFDSCSQSNPPSKVGALYHNFYGNSWIISELDCLMHKMDSSWKPFSSWLYNVYVEYIINAAEFLTIVHLLWLSTDVIAPFLSRFLSRLSVHKYNNNNIASVITAIST